MIKFDPSRNYTLLQGDDMLVCVSGESIVQSLKNGKWKSALMLSNNLINVSQTLRNRHECKNIKDMFGFVELTQVTGLI